MTTDLDWFKLVLKNQFSLVLLLMKGKPGLPVWSCLQLFAVLKTGPSSNTQSSTDFWQNPVESPSQNVEIQKKIRIPKEWFLEGLIPRISGME